MIKTSTSWGEMPSIIIIYISHARLKWYRGCDEWVLDSSQWVELRFGFLIDALSKESQSAGTVRGMMSECIRPLLVCPERLQFSWNLYIHVFMVTQYDINTFFIWYYSVLLIASYETKKDTNSPLPTFKKLKLKLDPDQ